MSKYTPSTDMVRVAYRYPQETPSKDAEFDRWLNQVKADAWDEAANTMRLYVRRNGLTEAYQLDTEDNPYRKQEEA